jgi:hypothetical protein
MSYQKINKFLDDMWIEWMNYSIIGTTAAYCKNNSFFSAVKKQCDF